MCPWRTLGAPVRLRYKQIDIYAGNISAEGPVSRAPGAQHPRQTKFFKTRNSFFITSKLKPARETSAPSSNEVSTPQPECMSTDGVGRARYRHAHVAATNPGANLTKAHNVLVGHALRKRTRICYACAALFSRHGATIRIYLHLVR